MSQHGGIDRAPLRSQKVARALTAFLAPISGLAPPMYIKHYTYINASRSSFAKTKGRPTCNYIRDDCLKLKNKLICFAYLYTVASDL